VDPRAGLDHKFTLLYKISENERRIKANSLTATKRSVYRKPKIAAGFGAEEDREFDMMFHDV
jgi:hypothetical protein